MVFHRESARAPHRIPAKGTRAIEPQNGNLVGLADGRVGVGTAWVSFGGGVSEAAETAMADDFAGDAGAGAGFFSNSIPAG